MGSLTWSLVVATLNREECLLRSLRANVSQDRPPRQVIVVDSSPEWQGTRARVLRELAESRPGIEWIYLHSEERSLTRQRNLGFGHCRGDIAFFLDDDSFMYPDCASEILRVYEADEAEELGGVCAGLAPDPPPSGQNAASDAPAEQRTAPSPEGALPWMKNQLSRLWYQERLFLPYDGAFHRRRIARIPTDVGVPVALFHGCRMTFRAAAVAEAGGFQEMLVRGAFGEDADFSYRVSRQRALVMAPRALLFHEQTPAQRAKVSVNACLVLLNAIALYRLNADGDRAGVVRISGFLARRAMLELLRDCLGRRSDVPNTRGVLRAFRHVAEVLRVPREHLPRVYPAIQRRLLEQG